MIHCISCFTQIGYCSENVMANIYWLSIIYLLAVLNNRFMLKLRIFVIIANIHQFYVNICIQRILSNTWYLFFQKHNDTVITARFSLQVRFHRPPLTPPTLSPPTPLPPAPSDSTSRWQHQQAAAAAPWQIRWALQKRTSLRSRSSTARWRTMVSWTVRTSRLDPYRSSTDSATNITRHSRPSSLFAIKRSKCIY